MVETLVALGVFGIFFAAVAFILQQVLTNIGESRLRTTALALGQTKMEIIRNLPYAQVGTVGGIPAGPVVQTESIMINSLSFSVKTSIIYVDDPFDGLTPADLVNNDYKRARVEVTWGGVYPSRQPVTLVTNIVPKGLETTAGGGTLFIQVYNSNGQSVSNAVVSIDNTITNPAIHTQVLTNANGLVILPGSPSCVTCYQVSVSKSGYSTDRTYASSEVTNPLQPMATVLEGQITQISFAIDTISTIVVNTVSPGPGYGPVVNVLFTLKGSKVIGYDAQDNPVYKYQFNTNSGGGTVSIPNIEWDTYLLDFTNSAHNLAGSNPTVPLAVSPGTNTTIQAVVTAKTSSTLLVTVRDTTQQLLASAAAQLSNTQLNFDVTRFTAATGAADFGQAFFGSLSFNNTYDLKVTLPGYQEATASVSVATSSAETVTLSPVQ